MFWVRRSAPETHIDRLYADWADPESMTWDPLEGEFLKKLDERPYVSLSRDRKQQEQKDAGAAEQQEQDTEMTDMNDEEMSLFDIRMPGVMTLEEVQKLDLDHWMLLVQGTLIHMTVSNILEPSSYLAVYSISGEFYLSSRD